MRRPHYNTGTDDRFSFRVKRRELLTILRMLNEGQSILLIGGRKIGKTVLLQQVRTHLTSQQGSSTLLALPLYQDLMGLTRPPTAARLFGALSQKIPLAANALLERWGREQNCPSPPDSWKTDPSIEFTSYLNDVLEYLDREVGRVVLIYLLDECETLLGFDETHTLLGNLRSLLGPETDYRVKMVVTGFRNMREYEDPETGTSPFTNVLFPVPLGLFVEEEFIELIAPLLTSLSTDGRTLQDKLWEVTGGHPCLIQMICYLLTTEYSIDSFEPACVQAIDILQGTAFNSWLASFTPADHNLLRKILAGNDVSQEPLSIEFLRYCGVLSVKGDKLCAPCGLFNRWYEEHFDLKQEAKVFAQGSSEASVVLNPESVDARRLSVGSSSTLEANESYALIMKGGGVKGLAYVGALRELQKYYDFDWFVGTSAGAIAALLLALGYTVDELEDILVSKNFKEFLDSSIIKVPLNLILKGGFYEARTFTLWLDRLIADRIESFEPLQLSALPRRATIYASRRYKRSLVFDSAGQNNDKAASFAVRCSMSIPIIFTPQRDQGLRVLDGGMQNNYPVSELLATNPGTKFIGLYLGHYYEGMPKEQGLLGEMLSIWTEAIDVEALNTHTDQVVLIDPRPIKTTDFNLTTDEKQFLLSAGRAAALRFLVKQRLANGPNEIEAKNAEESVDELRTEIIRVRQKQKRKNRIKFALFLLMIFSLGIGVYVFLS